MKPNGAFYLFIDIIALLTPDGIRTSAEFAERLLHEAHVALTAGEAFEAPGFLRISYATSMDAAEGRRHAHPRLHRQARSGRESAVGDAGLAVVQHCSAVIPESFVAAIVDVVGAEHVRRDEASRLAYGTDALKRGHPADLVVMPASAQQIAAIARLCHEMRVPLVPRGAGTGYTGGAVPLHGGVVVSLERLNRILEIDEENLLAVVEPAVITGDLQAAVEARGLFYPPDPQSLKESSLGGNIAECAGGPRAFKYGVTKRYVLGLEAVLPTGEIIRTGSKAVKNVVGYDLTQLLVGSEGTLAIVTQIILRLVPEAAGRRDAAGVFCRRAHGRARGLGADPPAHRAGDAGAGGSRTRSTRRWRTPARAWRPKAPARCCWWKSTACPRPWPPRPRKWRRAAARSGRSKCWWRATPPNASTSGAFDGSCPTPSG